MSDIIVSNNEEITEKAYLMCKNYIGGKWKNIDISNFIIRKIKDKPKVLLYYCSLREEKDSPNNAEPIEILFRIFRSRDNTEYYKVEAEATVFALLSERNIGPKLYGIFIKGRLEEYLHGNGLTRDELKDPNISAAIAKQLAKFHSLQPPIKKGITIYKNMKRRLSEKLNERSPEASKFISSYNLIDELQWLKNTLKSMKLPSVFSHNNFKTTNIRIRNDERFPVEDRIIFLEFSHSTYNYRAYDIAEYFFQWTIDFSKNFQIKQENYPSLEQQKLFIRSYLASSCSKVDNSFNTEDHLLKEVNALRMAPHLIYCSRIVENFSKGNSIYWDFARTRMKLYFYEKETSLH